VTALEQSPIVEALDRMIDKLGPAGAREALGAALDALSPVELASLASSWEGGWARPKQVAPAGDWLVWFLLTARGWGKTRTVARNIVEMVEVGGVREIGMAAQNEKKTYDVNVLGLIDASPPRFVPQWVESEGKLVWPNGAVAYAFTPESPGNIRSKNLDLAWLSEIQSWPETTRNEAYLNFKFATRVGKARTIIDCTPKKGHPLIVKLLAMAERHPERYRITRGNMRENLAHLAPAAVAALIEEFAGTSQGREELDGEQGEDVEGALFAASSFSRRTPTRLVRSVISVDPAVTKRGGSDLTGIVRVGLDVDGSAIVCADRTGKYSPGEWATIVLDEYVANHCDLVIVETNKGGDLLTQNLRAAAAVRGLEVVVVDAKWTPRSTDGVIYVREIYSRGEKADRAQPTATAYEKGRVLHLAGAKLEELETLLTTWEPKPGARSPDRLDALVGGVEEVLGLASKRRDPKAGTLGVDKAQSMLMGEDPRAMVAPVQNDRSRLFVPRSGGGRRVL